MRFDWVSLRPISVNKHSEKIFSLIKGAYQGLDDGLLVEAYPDWDKDREFKCGFGFSQTDGHYLASNVAAKEEERKHYVFYTMQDADDCRELGFMYFCFSDSTAAKLLIDQLNWAIGYDQSPYTIDWSGSEEMRILLRPLRKGEVSKPWVPKGA